MSDRATADDVVVPSDLAEARKLQETIEAALQANRYDEKDLFAIKLAVEEAIVNAMKHGNQLDPSKNVRVRYSVTPDLFEIRIEDEGPGFNPTEVPDPTLPENWERTCGRGVHIIKSFMTSVVYHGRGNVVIMSKQRKEIE